MSNTTGQNRLLQNAVVGWITHFIVIATGFIIPRQISDNLGTSSLGIWDLGWSTVNYLSITTLGMAGSLTRHIAYYRAENRPDKINSATTTVIFWQTAVALIVAVGSLIISFSITKTMHFDTPEDLADARTVIALLGFTLAVRMLFMPAGGIITGFHRWDINHSINAAEDVVLAIVMVSLLAFHGGLVSLAACALVLSILASLTRAMVAKKLYPELAISPRLWDKATALKMLRFGSKSFANDLQAPFILQTTIFFLAAYSGAATVAILSRSLALIKHWRLFIMRFTGVLMPIASSMLAVSGDSIKRKLLIDSARYGSALSFPIALVFIFYGDLLLKLWMGQEYANRTMMVILAFGHVLPISQAMTLSILTGFNAHGKVAIQSLTIAAISMAISILYFSHAGWSAIAAAIIISLARSLSYGIAIPFSLKKYHQINISDYLYHSIVPPVLTAIPLALCLWQAREMILGGHFLYAGLLWVGGGISYVILFWNFCLNDDSRRQIRGKLAPYIQSKTQSTKT